MDQVISLFQFIRELSKIKQKPILNYKDYRWSLTPDQLPETEEFVHFNFCDSHAGQDARHEAPSVEMQDNLSADSSGASGSERILLSVRKPEYEPCPRPDYALREWLEQGWDDFKKKAFYHPYLEENEIHYFEEDEERVSLFALWEKERTRWADRQEMISDVRKLFVTLYQLYQDLERDSETYELIVANGFIRDKQNTEIDHPVLTKRVKLIYDSKENELQIIDTESEPELYSVVIKELSDIQMNALPSLNDDVKANGYHPLDRVRTPGFLKSLIHQLSSDSLFLDPAEATAEKTISISGSKPEIKSKITAIRDPETETVLKPETEPTADSSMEPETEPAADSAPASLYDYEVPDNSWKKYNRILLYMRPVFLIRKKLDGSAQAVERVLDAIRETGYVPESIRQIVSGGCMEQSDKLPVSCLEERLAAVGGESVDILLAKESNREQLEIAKRIEQLPAVLVQGPPGTGKTHTIANLMGHFLAQGKSILVTSHTAKALKVLKEKLPSGMQDLCVSLLDDSKKDMEKSIDGITERLSSVTSAELAREMEQIAAARQELINQLGGVRKALYDAIEKESKTLTINGQKLTPSAAARFVVENEETLSYIPGTVRKNTPLPLSREDLSELYRTSQQISAEEEQEFEANVPDPFYVTNPEQFSELLVKKQQSADELQQILVSQSWKISKTADTGQWVVESLSDNENDQKGIGQKFNIGSNISSFRLKAFSEPAIRNLLDFCNQTKQPESWMIGAAVDGKRGSAYRQRWSMLIDQILRTCSCSEESTGVLFGKQIMVDGTANVNALVNALFGMKQQYSEKGKISSLTMLMNRQWRDASAQIRINGQPVSSGEDCDTVLKYLELMGLRQQLSAYWDTLMIPFGVPSFSSLDRSEQELTARNWIPAIRSYLTWSETTYVDLVERISAIGAPYKALFPSDDADSDQVKIEKTLRAVKTIIPALCQAALCLYEQEKAEKTCRILIENLVRDTRKNSLTCTYLTRAVREQDAAGYRDAYHKLEELYAKADLLIGRKKLLGKLRPYAYEWSEAIRNRDGIHGQGEMPENIEDAWQWKLCEAELKDILGKPFEGYMSDSERLGKDYRSLTAQYAEKCAWYHLLKNTEANISLKQSLIGWKQTVKRIGKGTGKNASMMRAKARELMVNCQEAVPAWIMTIPKALESLNPKENTYDVIIIDEASQSDLAALAVLYMGKKLVIVGDDKQVSPMAIGIEEDKMETLKQMYLKGKIPNAHLYDAKTSVYDIAATTFQPLMLREHFRCVPDIIGFCNDLSYDHKILPLRDPASSNLQPAIISCYVEDGIRSGGKTNEQEADAIIRMLEDALDNPQYDGKTFGIISMLGDEQVKLIQQKLFEAIDPRVIEERRILCGNSANFQGDERDVIYLSLVDSNNTAETEQAKAYQAKKTRRREPLRMLNFGVNDAIRKRYNVAVSRAKDQLIIVHSLELAYDLKEGDIRRTLLEYASQFEQKTFRDGAVWNEPEVLPDGAAWNEPEVLPDGAAWNKPEVLPDGAAWNEQKNEPEGMHASTKFELDMAENLRREGYEVIQPFCIGNYQLDMAVILGQQKVIIECDGETMYHQPRDIEADMERQMILQRTGWHFIRIRGSEYYRNKQKTLTRILEKLSAF